MYSKEIERQTAVLHTSVSSNNWELFSWCGSDCQRSENISSEVGICENVSNY